MNKPILQGDDKYDILHDFPAHYTVRAVYVKDVRSESHIPEDKILKVFTRFEADVVAADGKEYTMVFDNLEFLKHFRVWKDSYIVMFPFGDVRCMAASSFQKLYGAPPAPVQNP